jgi:2-octaprenyl-6-methoxyphenol hydroxylase
MTTDYDVIIVGSGLVGSSLALSLQDSKLKIALIDALELTPVIQRFLALNYSSYCFLQTIGIWSLVEPHSAPINALHVSQRGRFGSVYCHANDLQLPVLGYVIPAQTINNALTQLLSLNAQCQVIRPAKVIAVQPGKIVYVSIMTPSGSKTLSTKLLVAADGSNSSIRTLLNIPTRTVIYQQKALVTTTQLKQEHNNLAYERFVADGAIAMLPLVDKQQCATIWTASDTKINHLLQLGHASLVTQLTTEFGYRLGKIVDIAPCHQFPLSFIYVKQALHGNIIFIGNAAHTVHPIAAQGLNLAWHEIYQLSQQLKENFALQQDLSDSINLSVSPIKLHFGHYLQKLFNTQPAIWQNMRQLAMIGIDLCPPVKNYWARYFTGQQDF